jgi:pilus assembly protein Flp/PilA
MNKFTNALAALWTEDEGLTVVEYAIAGGLVGATVIGAFKLLGGKVGDVITYLVNNINAPA